MTVLDDYSRPDAIDAHVLAKSITAAKAGRTAVRSVDLAAAIISVSLQATIKGASTLVITIHDADWTLLDSGFLDADENNKVDQVDVNYPVGGRYWWRLSQINAQADHTVSLTFLDRLAMQMAAATPWGDKSTAPKMKANRASHTRAEFIKSLFVKAVPGVEFYCQELHDKQVAAAAATAGRGSSGGVAAPAGTAPVKMYDATKDTLASIPGDAGAVASYLDDHGGYKEAKARFPRLPVISISVQPGNNVHADIYDCEPSGKTASETVDAIASGLAKGAYGSATDLATIKSGLEAKGVPRTRYKLWLSAWPGSGANVTAGYDAHQYESHADYDISMCNPSFFT
jgi:hypothetical protein